MNDGFVASDPANVTITAITGRDAIVELLRQEITLLNALLAASFQNANQRNALTQKLQAAIKQVEQGQYADVLDKLGNDVLKKMDGCAATGAPGKNDWLLNADS